MLTVILADECVPYVAALRYKESGLRKRAQWEQVWQLQRNEDRTGEALGIPVPLKFSANDFRHASYWSLRGGLDIPRERFVSYPGAVAEVDSPLIGWSGWSDTDRVLALLDLVGVLQQQPQPSIDQVVPLLAGIQELIPWVRQWEDLEGLGADLGHAETYQHELDDRRTAFAQHSRLDLLAAAEARTALTNSHKLAVVTSDARRRTETHEQSDEGQPQSVGRYPFL
ncbi:hypothetical protein AB0945_05800 [Streptomyces sp. NPDC005474]|uniref:DUF7008 domain-containing protein n=1 Tax=Streptomyces sp. NPDC005474 TaxID=3154878 RepID=UPI0034560B6B